MSTLYDYLSDLPEGFDRVTITGRCPDLIIIDDVMPDADAMWDKVNSYSPLAVGPNGISTPEAGFDTLTESQTARDTMN